MSGPPSAQEIKSRYAKITNIELNLMVRLLEEKKDHTRAVKRVEELRDKYRETEDLIAELKTLRTEIYELWLIEIGKTTEEYSMTDFEEFLKTQ